MFSWQKVGVHVYYGFFPIMRPWCYFSNAIHSHVLLQKRETWSNKKWNAFSRSKANSFILFVQIPTDRYGRIEYRVHPFWQEKFCPSHEKDKTPRCCSCERMEVCKISVTEEVTFLMLQLLKSWKTSFSVNNYMHYIEKRSLCKTAQSFVKRKKKNIFYSVCGSFGLVN